MDSIKKKFIDFDWITWKRTWYLWFPIIEIITVIILHCLFNPMEFNRAWIWEQDFPFLFLVLVAIVKSFIVIKSVSYNLKGIRKISGYIHYFFLTLFFLVGLYVNLDNLKIISIIIVHILMYFWSNWIWKFKIHTHVIADILTIIYLFIIEYFSLLNSNNFIDFLIVLFLIVLRYLSVSILSTGIRNTAWGNIWDIEKRIYLIAEIASMVLFWAWLLAALEIVSESFYLGHIIGLFFVYFAILYLRLFCYKLYGFDKEYAKPFLSITLISTFYFVGVNAIEIDILIWFLPLFIFEFLDGITLITNNSTKQKYLVTDEAKRLCVLLKIFFVLFVVIFQLIKVNYRTRQTAWFTLILLKFYNESIGNQFIVEKIIFPVIAVFLALFLSSVLMWFNDKYILTKENLFEKITNDEYGDDGIQSVEEVISTLKNPKKRYRKRLRK